MVLVKSFAVRLRATTATMLLLLGSAACPAMVEVDPGPGPSAGHTDIPPNTLIAGQSVNFTTAIYAPASDANGDPVLLIWLASADNICNLLATGSQASNSTILGIQLVLASYTGARLVPQPGYTYQVVGSAAQEDGQGRYAGATFYALDAACGQTLSAAQSVAIDGGVAISRWPGSGAPLSGSLATAIGAETQVLQGNFTATYCAALAQTATTPVDDCVDPLTNNSTL